MTTGLYSADGYCVRQKAAANLPYGRCRSSYNGCGWMAAYNLLRAEGHPHTPEQVRAELARTLWFGGRMGTRTDRLCLYLRRQGVRLTPTLRPSRAAARPGGIAFYFTGRGGHFVTYLPAGHPGRFRFLNTGAGAPDFVSTLPEFRRRHFKLGLGVFLARSKTR